MQKISFFWWKIYSFRINMIKNGKSLKDLLTPNLTEKYHDDAKLIAGNQNAKDKLFFSDPLCPFCRDYVPDVIKYVKK